MNNQMTTQEQIMFNIETDLELTKIIVLAFDGFLVWNDNESLLDNNNNVVHEPIHIPKPHISILPKLAAALADTALHVPTMNLLIHSEPMIPRMTFTWINNCSCVLARETPDWKIIADHPRVKEAQKAYEQLVDNGWSRFECMNGMICLDNSN